MVVQKVRSLGTVMSAPPRSMNVPPRNCPAPVPYPLAPTASAGPMKLPEPLEEMFPREYTKVRPPLGCTATILELEPMEIWSKE
jgi:hypothetical protein